MRGWTIHLRRWRRARLGDDRGSASLELAIVAPALLLLAFGAIQINQIDQANALALAAAQQGADAARAYGVSDEAAVARAQRLLDRIGSQDLQSASVSVTGDPTQVTVVVQGTPRTVFGTWITVHKSWTAPRERFTTPQDTP